MFTLDDPDPSPYRARGTLRLGQVEYRCVRSKPYGDTPYDEDASEEDQVRFLAVYTGFRDIIQRYGPEVYLVDSEERAVFLEELPGKDIYDFFADTDWDSNIEFETARQVARNAIDLIESLARDGVCVPTSGRGYVVNPNDLSVRQMDFEELKPIQPNGICEAKVSLEEGLMDALRGALTNQANDNWEQAYDRAAEIISMFFYNHQPPQ